MSLYLREKLRVWALSPWPDRDIDDHVILTTAIQTAFYRNLLTQTDIAALLIYLYGYDKPAYTENIERALTVLETLTGYTNELFVRRYFPNKTPLEQKTMVAKMEAVSLWTRFNDHI